MIYNNLLYVILKPEDLTAEYLNQSLQNDFDTLRCDVSGNTVLKFLPDDIPNELTSSVYYHNEILPLVQNFSGSTQDIIQKRKEANIIRNSGQVGGGTRPGRNDIPETLSRTKELPKKVIVNKVSRRTLERKPIKERGPITGSGISRRP